MSSSTPGSPALPAGTLLLLMALTALGQMATNLVVPSLGRITAELAIGLEQAGLILSAVLVGIGLGQLVVGPLSDRHGRRPVLLAGLSLYILAGVLATLATSGPMLLLARLLQGLGASAGLALPRAIARDRFAGPVFLRAMSLLTLAMAVMPGLAPVLGSGIAGQFGWRASLAVTAASGAAVMVAVLLALPESHHSRSREGGLAATLGSYRKVLRNRSFLSFALGTAASIGGAYAEVAATQRLYEGIFGWGTLAVSLVPAGYALGFLAGGLLAPRLRRSPAQLVQTGTLMMLGAAAAFLALSLAGLLSPGLAIGLTVLSQFGVGFMAPPAIALALMAVEGAAGTASAVLGALHMAVGAVGAGMIGALPLPVPVALSGSMLGFAVVAALALRKR